MKTLQDSTFNKVMRALKRNLSLSRDKISTWNFSFTYHDLVRLTEIYFVRIGTIAVYQQKYRAVHKVYLKEK